MASWWSLRMPCCRMTGRCEPAVQTGFRDFAICNLKFTIFNREHAYAEREARRKSPAKTNRQAMIYRVWESGKKRPTRSLAIAGLSAIFGALVHAYLTWI